MFNLLAVIVEVSSPGMLMVPEDITSRSACSASASVGTTDRLLKTRIISTRIEPLLETQSKKKKKMVRSGFYRGLFMIIT